MFGFRKFRDRRFADHWAGTSGLLLALACSGESVNLGAEPLVADRSALSSYAAEWEGYTEGFVWAGVGSDRVALSIDEAGGGTLTFGDAPAPAPLGDVNVLFARMFPLDIGASPTSFASGNAGPVHDPLAGFPYSFDDVSVQDERIRLAVRRSEPGDAFCAAQPAVVDESQGDLFPAGGYTCGAQSNPDRDTSCYPGVSLSRAREIANDPNPDLSLLGDPTGCKTNAVCSVLCACTEHECQGRSRNDESGSEAIALDAALDEDGSRLVGTLDFRSAGLLVTVRLRRTAGE